MLKKLCACDSKSSGPRIVTGKKYDENFCMIIEVYDAKMACNECNKPWEEEKIEVGSGEIGCYLSLDLTEKGNDNEIFRN